MSFFVVVALLFEIAGRKEKLKGSVQLSEYLQWFDFKITKSIKKEKLNEALLTTLCEYEQVSVLSMICTKK